MASQAATCRWLGYLARLPIEAIDNGAAGTALEGVIHVSRVGEQELAELRI